MYGKHSATLEQTITSKNWLQTDQLTRRQVRALLRAIAGVAILLRVSAAILMGNRVQELPGIHDQISYDRLAQNVVAGRGFSFDVDGWPATRAGEPTAHWSYLMTLYLAGVYSLAGHHPLVARLIQAVISGILMPVLTFDLSRRLTGKQTVGLIAAAISAVYIYFFYYGAALMTETYFIIAILAVFDTALALGPSRRSTVWQWAGFGALMGTAVLLRQTFLPVIPFLLLGIAWVQRRELNIRHPLITLAVIGLMILPWTLRNALAFGEFLLLNSNSGFAFFWANHPIHGTNFISILGPEHPSYHELIPKELLHLNEAALDKALLRLWLQFVTEDPMRYLLLSISRIKDYFLFWPRRDSSLLSNICRVGSFGVFLPVMIYGLARSFKHLRTGGERHIIYSYGLLYTYILIYTGIHLASWAYVRYRLPVDAVLVIFAAIGVHDLCRCPNLMLSKD